MWQQHRHLAFSHAHTIFGSLEKDWGVVEGIGDARLSDALPVNVSRGVPRMPASAAGTGTEELLQMWRVGGGRHLSLLEGEVFPTALLQRILNEGTFS